MSEHDKNRPEPIHHAIQRQNTPEEEDGIRRAIFQRALAEFGERKIDEAIARLRAVSPDRIEQGVYSGLEPQRYITGFRL